MKKISNIWILKSKTVVNYINELIEQDRRSKIEARMRAGYIAQSQNQEIQEEDLLWEVAIADGIKDEN